MISSGHQKGRVDFELNIVPVIDCLTILVTFMLAAGIYYSIAMLDIRLSAAGKEVSAPSQSDVSVEVQLSADKSVVLKVSGKEARRRTFDRSPAGVDLAALSAELEGIKSRWPSVKSATLESNREASYQDVVSVLETIRRSHPDVLLGGF